MSLLQKELSNFLLAKGGSVDPRKFPSETFELYSIPSYDNQQPEMVIGSDIGSSKKCIQENDVLLSRIVPHIKRCWVVKNQSENRKLGSGEWIIFRTSEVVPGYLRYYLLSNGFHQQFMQTVSGVGGSLLRARPALVGKIKIPLPPLPVQKKIATILDTADALKQKDKALIAKYDELSQSLFLDMFGDPVTNPKGWDIDSLASFGSFKNGLNFSKGETGVKVRYLGVGDFGTHSKISCIESLSLIDLTTLPSEGYFLNNGDIVFVRSNGNKELVGRCIVVYPGDEKVTYSGFCIRYRIENSGINSTYLAHLFRMQSFRRKMLQGGQGANIQNINQKTLVALKIPKPQIDLQNQFAERIVAIEKQKKQAQTSLQKSKDLFNCLLQKAFKGELVS